MTKPREEYSEEEAVRRPDDAIRRAVNTPTKPNKEYVGRSERVQTRKSSIYL